MCYDVVLSYKQMKKLNNMELGTITIRKRLRRFCQDACRWEQIRNHLFSGKPREIQLSKQISAIGVDRRDVVMEGVISVDVIGQY